LIRRTTFAKIDTKYQARPEIGATGQPLTATTYAVRILLKPLA
jgi:hypothetical protein